MFEAAVTKFSKSVGADGLQPTPTLDQSGKCEPYHVVVKKYRKWAWQSPVYEPSPFSLSQLIIEKDKPLEDILKPTTEKALEYNKIHKLNVNGKIGAQVKAILDFELDGSDSVDVEAKFGDVNRVSIDEASLMTQLSSRHLDPNHEFVKQVREHPRKVLCIIVSSYTLANGGTVTAQKSISGEEKVDEEKLAKVVVGGDEDMKMSDDNSKSMVLVKDTVVAYKELEIRVAANKSLHLILTSDLRGGFDDEDAVDGAFSSSSIRDNPLPLFKPLLEMEEAKRQELNQAILHMCNYPKDIDTFLVLMKKASALSKEAEATEINITKDTQLTVLKEKFLCPDFDWATILQMAGFNFIADGTVEFPKASAVYLDPIICVYKGLIELDDDQLIFFADLKQPMGKPIIYLLSRTINQKTATTKDKELAALFVEANPGIDFVNALDYDITKEGSITPPSGNSHQLHGASCALYGLFWELSYDDHSRHWCNIL